jgi:CRISPR-associated protein Cmr2
LRLRTSEHLDAVSLLKRVFGAIKYQDKVLQTRTLAQRAQNPHVNNTPDGDDTTEDLPQPYFAILVADGDRMGQLISGKDTAKNHRELAQKLFEFSQHAKEIVKRHHGVTIYSGGDDVMAFLPVNTAIDCANKLAEQFAQSLRTLATASTTPTLSAGVAVVHYREPLSMSLQHARSAEKTAKQAGRNRLSVALHTRGGQPLTATAQWQELSWVEHMTDYAAGRITRGLAYELRELATEWPQSGFDELMWKEVRRIVARKQVRMPGAGDGKRRFLLADELDGLVSRWQQRHSGRDSLRELANELVIARFLSGLGRGNDMAVDTSTPRGEHAQANL